MSIARLGGIEPVYRFFPFGRYVDEIAVNAGSNNAPAPRTDGGTGSSMGTFGAVPVSNVQDGFLTAAIDGGAFNSVNVHWPAHRQNANMGVASGTWTSAENRTRIPNAFALTKIDGDFASSVRVRVQAYLNYNGNSGSGTTRRAWVHLSKDVNNPGSALGNSNMICGLAVYTTDTDTNKRAEVYVGSTLVSTLYASSTTDRSGIYTLDVTFNAAAVSFTAKQAGGSSVSGSQSTASFDPATVKAMCLGVVQYSSSSLSDNNSQGSGLGQFEIYLS